MNGHRVRGESKEGTPPEALVVVPHGDLPVERRRLHSESQIQRFSVSEIRIHIDRREQLGTIGSLTHDIDCIRVGSMQKRRMKAR